jgi:hypothetical protein
METSLTVLSVNIRHDMTPLQRAHDMRIAAKRYPGIKFFQEIDPPSKPQLKTILNNNGFSCQNLKTEVPIGMPGKWDIHGSPVYLLNKGKRRHNPNRYLSVVLAEKNSFHVAFCNMHMQQHPGENEYNRTLWNEYYAKAQNIMLKYRNSGYTVIFGGDLNKTGSVLYFPEQHTLINNGLDHLYAEMATGVHLVHKEVWINRNLNTDHNLIGARITLRK